MPHFYPIGKPDEAWGDSEREEWFQYANKVQRSYAEDVLVRVEVLKTKFDVEQYSALSQDPQRYPLFVVKTKDFRVGENASKPCILVTGGTHGYETSGVHGALLFAEKYMEKYSALFNIAVCPCISPWSYECIQRWNAKAIDPNRHFLPDSPCEECAAMVNLVASMNVPQWLMHCDLHETTDSDDTEFRPAKASRDGLELPVESIPDGFYLIGNKLDPQEGWHKAMIDAVAKITHIAPPDANGQIVGLDQVQRGVVNSSSVGKGKGVTNALYGTTTEVYPDSKTRPVSGDVCNEAQVAAVVGGLEYIIVAESVGR